MDKKTLRAVVQIALYPAFDSLARAVMVYGQGVSDVVPPFALRQAFTATVVGAIGVSLAGLVRPAPARSAILLLVPALCILLFDLAYLAVAMRQSVFDLVRYQTYPFAIWIGIGLAVVLASWLLRPLWTESASAKER